MTGSGVTEASMPGRCAAPPAPAMITRSPRLSADEPSYMEYRALGLARVDNLENRAAGGFDHTAIADLAATLGIKRSFGSHDQNAIFAVAMGREHFGLGVVAMVSDEARGGAGAELYFGSNRVVLARGAPTLALLFHEALELRDINFNSVVAQVILREVEREPVGVIELKRRPTR